MGWISPTRSATAPRRRWKLFHACGASKLVVRRRALRYDDYQFDTPTSTPVRPPSRTPTPTIDAHDALVIWQDRVRNGAPTRAKGYEESMAQTLLENIRVTSEQWGRIETAAREREISPNQLVVDLAMEALDCSGWPSAEAEIRVARASLFAAQALARDLMAAGREEEVEEIHDFISTIVPDPDAPRSEQLVPVINRAAPTTATPTIDQWSRCLTLEVAATFGSPAHRDATHKSRRNRHVKSDVRDNQESTSSVG